MSLIVLPYYSFCFNYSKIYCFVNYYHTELRICTQICITNQSTQQPIRAVRNEIASMLHNLRHKRPYFVQFVSNSFEILCSNLRLCAVLWLYFYYWRNGLFVFELLKRIERVLIMRL